MGSAHARAALALLILERNRGVTRDALAETMWPEGLPPTWASALRSVISRVRAYMARASGLQGGSLLVAQGGVYVLQLPPDTVVDVEQAELDIAAAQEALAQHDSGPAQELATEATARLRRPLLADNDSEWATAQRERLAELLVVGLEVSSQAACIRGDAVHALTAAMEAVERAPLRESAHRCLMAAHATAGNRAEALRVYQALRRLLAEELGVDPDHETEAAYLGLLGSTVQLPSHGSSPGPDPSGVSPHLVGRDAELAIAAHAWTQALQGTSQMLLVVGQAGIGKTRFATEFAHGITSTGARVLFGRCDQEAFIPYQPFVEMLDGLVATTPRSELPVLPDSAWSELAAVFPSLAGPADLSSTRDRAVLFDAVTRLIHHVALDRPLLLVLDDLHWADSDSAYLLRHLVRHTRGRRLLVMAIARSDVPMDEPFGHTVQAISRDGQLLRLQLDGLDLPAVKRLVQETAADPSELLPHVGKLVDDTSGNPFMLIELLRALPDGVPLDQARRAPNGASLDDLVASWLTMVSTTTRALLVVAAVAGSPFDLKIVAAAAGLDMTTATDALEAAVASGLVVDATEPGSGRERYRFAHDLLRRQLYGRLSATRRRYLHERVADAMEDHPGDRGLDVYAVAHHRCAGAESGGDVHAVRWALAAASEAHAEDAEVNALRWCQRALEHVRPGDAGLEAEVLTELGLAQTRHGLPEGGSTLFDGALRAQQCGRVDVAARAALGLADVARQRPQLRQDANALIREVLADPPTRRLTETSRLPRQLWGRLMARQIELSESSGDIGQTQVATAVGILRRELRDLAGPDELDERMELAQDLRVAAEALADAEALLLAHHHRAMVGSFVGEGSRTDEALSAMTAAVDDAGRRVADRLIQERNTALSITQGRFGDVATTPPTVAALPERDALDPGAMEAHQRLVGLWLQGRIGQEPLDEPLRGRDQPPLIMAESALVALARGERGRAHVAVRELASDPWQEGRGDDWLHTMGLLSLAATALGNPKLAEDLANLLAPYDQLMCCVGYRSFVGTVAFHCGHLAACIGDWAEAERHLTEAIRQLTAMGAEPWLALAQRTLARVLDAQGRSADRDRIATLRAEASQLAASLGLRPLDATLLKGPLDP